MKHKLYLSYQLVMPLLPISQKIEILFHNPKGMGVELVEFVRIGTTAISVILP